MQKGVNYYRIRIFNNLQQRIRDLSSDVINFKQDLKKFFPLARFEVFTVVPMKNGVFWDVTP
jgi:hypothetical protein